MPKLDRDDGLADDLGPAPQSEAALATDLDEVVEEADRAESHEEEEQQHRRRRGQLHRDQLGGEIGHHRGEDDDEAAHGGRAALGVVRGRTVVADLLAVATAREHHDRVAGADQRDQQGQATAEQDRSHRVLLPSAGVSCDGGSGRASSSPWRRARAPHRAMPSRGRHHQPTHSAATRRPPRHAPP